MLSPTIAALAATAMTSGSERRPLAARAPATIRLVSPGTSAPAASAPTKRASSGYPMLPGTLMIAASTSRFLWSRRPVFGEGGELQFVGCGAGALVGEESDGVSDLVRVGERGGCHSRTGGAGEWLDAGVDDQECDLDPVGAELEGGRVGDCLDPE